MVFSEGCTRGLLFKVNVLWMSSPLLSLALFDAVKFSLTLCQVLVSVFSPCLSPQQDVPPFSPFTKSIQKNGESVMYSKDQKSTTYSDAESVRWQ